MEVNFSQASWCRERRRINENVKVSRKVSVKYTKRVSDELQLYFDFASKEIS